MTYSVTRVPLLLSFSRGEPQWETRVTDVNKLLDRRFMIDWIEKEAKRAGAGGAGGSWFKSLFG